GDRVRRLLAGLALEGAVRAARRADVGEVEVPVDVEHHPVAVELGAPVVGEPAEPGEVVAGVERLAVLAGEASPLVHLRFKIALQPGVHPASPSRPPPSVRPSPGPSGPASRHRPFSGSFARRYAGSSYLLPDSTVTGGTGVR